MFKFERLEIWQLALDYIDLTYIIAQQMPSTEDFNLKSQLRRAATSIALNIAEGSTGPPDRPTPSKCASWVSHCAR